MHSSLASSSSVSVDFDFPKFFSLFRLAAAFRRAIKRGIFVLSTSCVLLDFIMFGPLTFHYVHSFLFRCPIFAQYYFLYKIFVQNRIQMGTHKKLDNVFNGNLILFLRCYLPALHIHSTYPFSSFSTCCCCLSFKNSCLFSTFSLSLANSLK